MYVFDFDYLKIREVFITIVYTSLDDILFLINEKLHGNSAKESERLIIA